MGNQDSQKKSKNLDIHKFLSQMLVVGQPENILKPQFPCIIQLQRIEIQIFTFLVSLANSRHRSWRIWYSSGQCGVREIFWRSLSKAFAIKQNITDATPFSHLNHGRDTWRCGSHLVNMRSTMVIDTMTKANS